MAESEGRLCPSPISVPSLGSAPLTSFVHSLGLFPSVQKGGDLQCLPYIDLCWGQITYPEVLCMYTYLLFIWLICLEVDYAVLIETISKPPLLLQVRRFKVSCLSMYSLCFSGFQHIIAF
ncbi:hypothetical protein BDV39DRAFT_184116 [Aspergillus sergii]|uniref:Uncharacterized protein n=1 Tax=Aspergillus sergii TaxID=1034303 RepID=A0A5N6WN72_9EURO|nr:hypothetical protein BDV39DRAFT_184116 [Aspergillus sergii]